MKTVHSILMTPFDTLFFRDHRPFEAGEQQFCQSLFPTPMTFMGALSAAYLELNQKSRLSLLQAGGAAPDEYLGPYAASLDSPGSFGIKSVLLAKEKMILIPIPADRMVRRDNRTDLTVRRIMPLAPNLMSPPDPDFEYREGYMQLKDFATGNLNLSIHEFERPFAPESRTGIAIDPSTRHTEEGALYFTNHYRPRDYKKNQTSFWVHYRTANDRPLPIPRSWRLGGENRLVHGGDPDRESDLHQNLQLSLEHIKNVCEQNWLDQKPFNFSVYLLTPAVFKDGWKPERWPWEGRAEFIAACVPKTVYVSGFQLLKNRTGTPRPLYRAAPAGSVYFFQSSDDSLKTELLNDYLFGKSISEIYPQAGFGTTLVNSWHTYTGGN